MAYTYNIKQDFKPGHAPTCKLCGRKIKETAKGVKPFGTWQFYHPSCFHRAKIKGID